MKEALLGPDPALVASMSESEVALAIAAETTEPFRRFRGGYERVNLHIGIRPPLDPTPLADEFTGGAVVFQDATISLTVFKPLTW
jgi:hypothetical protein